MTDEGFSTGPLIINWALAPGIKKSTGNAGICIGSSEFVARIKEAKPAATGNVIFKPSGDIKKSTTLSLTGLTSSVSRTASPTFHW